MPAVSDHCGCGGHLFDILPAYAQNVVFLPTRQATPQGTKRVQNSYECLIDKTGLVIVQITISVITPPSASSKAEMIAGMSFAEALWRRSNELRATTARLEGFISWTLIVTHASGVPFGESYTASKWRISGLRTKSARRSADSRPIGVIALLFSNDSSNAVCHSRGRRSAHSESAKYSIETGDRERAIREVSSPAGANG